MNRLDISLRVRSYARDFSNATFRDGDIDNYINEAIQRCKQVIPELRGMKPLLKIEHVPILLPEHYHHLLAVYAVARCFDQDERHYQASTLMNEFEVKLQDLKIEIDNGDEVILDEDGNEVHGALRTDYVVDAYFNPRKRGVLNETVHTPEHPEP